MARGVQRFTLWDILYQVVLYEIPHSVSWNAPCGKYDSSRVIPRGRSWYSVPHGVPQQACQVTTVSHLVSHGVSYHCYCSRYLKEGHLLDGVCPGLDHGVH